VRDLFGVGEVLALAKGLTALDGVRVMRGKRRVTYITLLLDRHQVMRAEGAWTESFFPGPTALRMLERAQRAEIEALFPGLADDPATGYGVPARRVLTRHETEALVTALQRKSGGRAQATPGAETGPTPGGALSAIT